MEGTRCTPEANWTFSWVDLQGGVLRFSVHPLQSLPFSRSDLHVTWLQGGFVCSSCLRVPSRVGWGGFVQAVPMKATEPERRSVQSLA